MMTLVNNFAICYFPYFIMLYFSAPKQSPAQPSQLQVFPRSSQEWRSSTHSDSSTVSKGFCDVPEKRFPIFGDLMIQPSSPFNSAFVYDDSRGKTNQIGYGAQIASCLKFGTILDQQISTMEPKTSTTTADEPSSSCHTCSVLYTKCELQQR